MKSRRGPLFPGGMLLIVLAAVLAVSFAGRGRVVWWPDRVETTLAPAEARVVTVAFSSSRTIPDAQLWVVPELQPFVRSVVPARITPIEADILYEVELHVVVPPTAAPGEYGGTIHVKGGSRTYPQPLKVRFTVAEAQNVPPVADAGPDQTVDVTTNVQLDGSGSYDYDGDPLTYAWSVLARPHERPARRQWIVRL
jgi:hypothetical protein